MTSLSRTPGAGDRLRFALDPEGGEVLAVLLRELGAAGQDCREWLHGGLAWALADGGVARRGPRWTHALLTLAAAQSLVERHGQELGRRASVNSLYFLREVALDLPSESSPAAVAGRVGSVLERAREDDLSGAESRLVAHHRAGSWKEEIRQLALAHHGDWGHGPIVGRALIRLASTFPDLAQSVLCAGLRYFLPPLREGLESRPVGSEGLPVVEGVEERAALLLGNGRRSRFGASMVAAGELEPWGQATCLAACRAFVEEPGLRTLHGVTASSALLELIRDRSSPGAVDALWSLAVFVDEGARQVGVRSRARGRPEMADLGSAPTSAEGFDELLFDACEREALPNFGHQIKLAEACGSLVEMLPGEFSDWPKAVLAASRPSWTLWRRHWAAFDG